MIVLLWCAYVVTCNFVKTDLKRWFRRRALGIVHICSTSMTLCCAVFVFGYRHGSLLTFWRFTNLIIIIIIIML